MSELITKATILVIDDKMRRYCVLCAGFSLGLASTF